MPSTSKKQHDFMEAVAHNPAFAKKAGVPRSVGQEFSKADTGRTFKQGGNMEKKHEMHAHHMKMAHHHLKEAMKHGGATHKAYAKGGEVTGKHGVEEKDGMTTAKMGKAEVGKTAKHGEHTIQKKGHTRAMEPKMGAGKPLGMKHGGKAHKK